MESDDLLLIALGIGTAVLLFSGAVLFFPWLILDKLIRRFLVEIERKVARSLLAFLFVSAWLALGIGTGLGIYADNIDRARANRQARVEAIFQRARELGISVDSLIKTKERRQR